MISKRDIFGIETEHSLKVRCTCQCKCRLHSNYLICDNCLFDLANANPLHPVRSSLERRLWKQIIIARGIKFSDQ